MLILKSFLNFFKVGAAPERLHTPAMTDGSGSAAARFFAINVNTFIFEIINLIQFFFFYM